MSSSSACAAASGAGTGAAATGAGGARRGQPKSPPLASWCPATKPVRKVASTKPVCSTGFARSWKTSLSCVGSTAGQSQCTTGWHTGQGGG
eukprot:8745538-Pyramimonas_sp.AAC.1